MSLKSSILKIFCLFDLIDSLFNSNNNNNKQNTCTFKRLCNDLSKQSETRKKKTPKQHKQLA